MIRCNHTYGVNLLNTGFDCEVAAKASELKKLPLVSSSLAYILGVVVKLIYCILEGIFKVNTCE